MTIDWPSEFGATLSLCTSIRPFEIERVLAGRSAFEDGTERSGFIIKLRDGFAYIWSSRYGDGILTGTHRFRVMPEHLFLRAAVWNRNEEELNANLPQAKSEAKNGVSAGTFRATNSHPLVRTDAR